jgi:hypothetical protein
LKPKDRDEDRQPRENGRSGGHLHEGTRFLQHPTPGGRGWRQPEAKEAEPGLAQNRAGKLQCRLHDDRTGTVGQDVLNQDLPGPLAQRHGGDDIVGFLALHHCRTHHAGEARNPDDGQRKDDRPHRAAEDRDQRDRQQQAGKGHQRIHEAHDRGVRRPPTKPESAPSPTPIDDREEGHCKADLKRDDAAMRQPRQQVTPEVVGAEQMNRTGRLQRVAHVHLVGIERQEKRQHQREDDDEAHQDQADNGQPIAPQTAQEGLKFGAQVHPGRELRIWEPKGARLRAPRFAQRSSQTYFSPVSAFEKPPWRSVRKSRTSWLHAMVLGAK